MLASILIWKTFSCVSSLALSQTPGAPTPALGSFTPMDVRYTAQQLSGQHRLMLLLSGVYMLSVSVFVCLIGISSFFF